MKFLRLLFLISLTLVCSIGCGRNNRFNGKRDRLGNVRIINAVSNVLALDFYLDSKLYLEDVGFLESNGYAEEKVGSHAFQVNIKGSGTFLIDTTAVLSDSSDTTLLVFGTVEKPVFRNLNDDNDPTSEEIARIRVLQTASSEKNLDVYILNSTQSIESTKPALDGLSYRTVSRYVPLLEDTYSLIVTERGSKNVIAEVSPTKLKGYSVYTLLISDSPGAVQPAHVTLLTDR